MSIPFQKRDGVSLFSASLDAYSTPKEKVGYYGRLLVNLAYPKVVGELTRCVQGVITISWRGIVSAWFEPSRFKSIREERLEISLALRPKGLLEQLPSVKSISVLGRPVRFVSWRSFLAMIHGSPSDKRVRRKRVIHRFVI